MTTSNTDLRTERDAAHTGMHPLDDDDREDVGELLGELDTLRRGEFMSQPVNLPLDIARLAELGGRAADWIDRLVAPAPTTAIADRDAFILREFVREGVCLSCGGAVLNSGEHVEEDRHADRDARILEDAAEEWGIAYKGASGPVDRMSEAHARNHLVEWPEDTLMARKVFPWIAVSRRREASPQEGGVE